MACLFSILFCELDYTLSTATAAYVMQEKFQNGVPLYRREAYWKG